MTLSLVVSDAVVETTKGGPRPAKPDPEGVKYRPADPSAIGARPVRFSRDARLHSV